MTTNPKTPRSAPEILIARVWAALDDLAEYPAANLTEVHTILRLTAGRGTDTGSLAEKLSEVIEQTVRSQHLTALPDQGDLVHAAGSFYATDIVDGQGADVIDEALDAIERPWDARTADEFLTAHGAPIEDGTAPARAAVPDAEIEKHLDRGLARLAASLPTAWDDGPAIPKIPGPRPPSDGTGR